MKIYLAEMSIWNYTITTFDLTEEGARASIKKEWLRQKKKNGFAATWSERKDWVQVYELEQNKIDWR
jgi:hypothetical protein